MIFTRADIDVDGLLSFYDIQKVVEILPLEEVIKEEVLNESENDSVEDDGDSSTVVIIVIIIAASVLVIMSVVFGYLIMKKK